MEQRRLTGWIALIVLILGVAVFVYNDYRRNRDAAEAPIVTSADSPTAASTEPAAKESAYFPDKKPGAVDASGEAAATDAGPAPAPAAESPPASGSAEAPASAIPPADGGGSSTLATESAAAPKAAAEPARPAEGAAATESPAAAPADGKSAAPAAPQTADSAAPATSPQPETVPTPAPEAAADAAPAPEPQIALVEPPSNDVEAASPAPAEPAAAPPAAAVPSFDIVRVEPTGDTVIAGVAAPHATVELLDGEGAVATATANERGEWVVALDKPLPPGAHDLAIRTTSPDKSTVTLSDQRVAVAIPEKPTEAPLVVLNTPDEPTKVLQIPAKPEDSPEEPEVALAEPGDPATTVEPGTPPAPRERPAGVASAPSETEIAEAPGPSPGQSGETESAAAAPAEPATETEGTRGGELSEAQPAETEKQQPASADAESASTEPTGDGTPPASAAETAAEASAPEAPAVVEAPREEPAVVEAPPEKRAEPQPEVSVSAVEADTAGSVFVAGTAAGRERVRVYLDGELLGEAIPSPSGTWLLEVQRELPAGTYTVRADQVGADGKVIVRAEVPFEREVEVAVLTPVGGTGGPAGASASGSLAAPQTIIIKRTDNLWRISRKMYGKGIRWSTIYEANRDQIKNPRWIYPGQIFVMPSGDTKWEVQ